MKKNVYILGMLLVLLGMACKDDDDSTWTPAEPVVRTFNQMFPLAQRVEWKTVGNYIVADFYYEHQEKDAWFDKNGKWYMTETDIFFETLPEKIKTAFRNSEYSSWKVEDVDVLERIEMEKVYVIEVEQGDVEKDLYYVEDGTLVKVMEDRDGNEEHWPVESLPQKIKDYLNTHYAGAKIIEYERERNVTEVDIFHENRYKEVKFGQDDAWISTCWEILEKDVPAAVMATIRSQYAGYKIDDIEYVERAAGVAVYLFELEKGEEDLYVMVDASGNIVQN